MEHAIAPFVQPLFPVFMTSLKDEDDEVRSNTIYGLGLLAFYGGDIMLPYPFNCSAILPGLLSVFTTKTGLYSLFTYMASPDANLLEQNEETTTPPPSRSWSFVEGWDVQKATRIVYNETSETSAHRRWQESGSDRLQSFFSTFSKIALTVPLHSCKRYWECQRKSATCCTRGKTRQSIISILEFWITL